MDNSIIYINVDILLQNQIATNTPLKVRLQVKKESVFNSYAFRGTRNIRIYSLSNNF